MKKAIFFSNLFLMLLSFQLVQAQTETILVHSDEPSEGLYIISDVNKEKFGYARYDAGRELYVEVIPNKYESARSFQNGVAIVMHNEKWGIIDREERLIAPFKYDFIQNFGQTYKGLAVVEIGDKKGVINESGYEVIPVIYEAIGFEEWGFHSDYLLGTGLISVTLNGKIGVFNENGNEVTPIQYDDMNSSKYGVIPVAIDDKYGVTDLNGKVIIPLQYDYTTVLDMPAGFVKVKLNQKYGLLDTTGDIVIPVEFDEIDDHPYEKVIYVKSDGKWGFYNEKGKEVLAPKYESHFHFRDGLAQVTENGKEYFININGVPQ